jgi:TatD DNase family protein
VGETGLDFNRNFSPADAQQRVFEQHLELAAATGKPLFLHQRDAHETFLPLLSKYRPKVSGGVVHCFTDTETALRDYLELDMYIGITGWVCDERRGKDLQEIVSLIPDDRLLIETDAPYLLPRSLRPKPKSRRNVPAYLPEVLRTLAHCRDQQVEELALRTTENARRLFALPGGVQ